jgi:hypothetical protein
MKQENDVYPFNRRDFIKGGSVATMMALMGGVEIKPLSSSPTRKQKRRTKGIKSRLQ